MNPKESGLVLPDLPEPIVLGATHYNSGVFGGGHHDELDRGQEPVLNSAEQLTHRALTAYLQRHERVAFLDLGAMCGLSATILAAQFPKEISDGRLVMIASQQEQVYSIENILAEAKNRLALQSLREKLIYIDRTKLSDVDTKPIDAALKKTKLFLTSGELTFMEAHHPLVHFVSGVNTEKLRADTFKDLGVEKIHFLHEFSAGFTFADNSRVAAIAVANAMAADGMILSIVGWHHYSDNSAFLQWESRGISAKDLSLPGLPLRPAYTLFTFPDAPRVI